MTENGGLLSAYALDGEGGGRRLNLAEVAAVDPAGLWVWAHFDGRNEAARRWLKEKSGIDRFALRALLSEASRPRLEIFEQGGVLINLRGMGVKDTTDPDQLMVSLRMWVSGHRVITVRMRRSEAAGEVRKRLENGAGPRSGGDIVTALTFELLDHIAPVIEMIDAGIDKAEDEVLARPHAVLRAAVVAMRRRATQVRRYVVPQREVIANLRVSELPWIDSNDRRNFMEAHDRISRYVEDLDALRERAQIIHEELQNALSDRLNRNMYILSVIAAVFLPLSLLTGLFGINVGGLPGEQNPHAFYWFLGGLGVIFVIQLAIFRWLRWF